MSELHKCLRLLAFIIVIVAVRVLSLLICKLVLSRAMALIVLQLGSRLCDCGQTQVIAFDMTI
jgi:hypothetical protein